MRYAGLFVIFFFLLLAACSGGGSGGSGGDDQQNAPSLGDDTNIVTDTVVLAFNDLGMHCLDREFSIFSILPPFNVVNAQVIVQDGNGKPAVWTAMPVMATCFPSAAYLRCSPADQLTATTTAVGDAPGWICPVANPVTPETPSTT